MNITTRLDHYAVAVENTDAFVAWYARVLGLAVHAQAGPIGTATQKTYLIGPPAASGEAIAQGMMIEVMPKNAAPRRPRVLHDAGLSHTAWYVPDFDAALAHLKTCNVKFLSDIVTAVGGGRIISFEDCDANMVQIVERL
jgi:catechol 2,3-dioxygenase-like lactoylglutathione lyase family enzyme